MSIRRPLQFEGAAGTYTWPRYSLEYDASQALEGATVQLVGADYEFDQLGDAPAVKRPGVQTVRFLLVGEPAAIEAELDDMRAKVYLGGRGWFYVEDDDGTQRRCRARVQAMPPLTLGTRDRQRVPMILTFSQQSDFQAVEPVADSAVLVGSPAFAYLTLPGNAIVRGGVLTVDGPFTGLKITNGTLNVPGSTTPTAYIFETAREAVAGDRIEVDIGAYTVRFSEDAGGTWADDADNVVLQPGQVGLFAFAPGDNVIMVEGAGGATLAWSVSGAWV